MRALRSRLLPQGWADLLRQIFVFCGAYWLYRLVRGMVDGRAQAAFEHARQIVALERHAGVFVEPAVQAWASGREWLIDAASWTYLNSHFTITTVTLAFIYLARNEHFYFVRNMFTVAMGLALVGYLAFPTAPPRLMPEWGFTDSVSAFTGVTSGSAVDALYNPFAAVPSMHVGFALMLGLTMARIARRRWAKALWCAYPAVVAFVVVVTANHWIFDAVTGALTAAISAVAAQLLFARARPHAWAWAPPSRFPARAPAAHAA
jgi:membrane-associated phospholipid phosphatase